MGHADAGGHAACQAEFELDIHVLWVHPHLDAIARAPNNAPHKIGPYWSVIGARVAYCHGRD